MGKRRSTSPNSQRHAGKRRRKEEKHKREHSRASNSDSQGSDAERALGIKLLQYAAFGKRRRVKALLKQEPALVRAADASGSTGLHEACRHGHTEVAELLLRRGASASAQDKAGNTPGHVAGMHGHLDVLVMLLQADRPPDVDAPNHKGVTIRQLMEAAMDPEPLGPVPPSAPAAAWPSRGIGAAAGPSAGANGDAKGQEWQERLQQELSDDDWGAGGWGRQPQPGPAPDPFNWQRLDDDDDSWADDIWAEMQRRRPSAPAPAFAAYGGEPDRRAAREKSAAEAAANSKRILEEQQAAGDWRQRMMKQIAEAGGSSSRRLSYEEAWAAFAALPASRAISYRDIPWPLPEASMHDTALLQRTILQGATGPADVRTKLRAEMLRWHPDKFHAKYGARLAKGDAARVVAGVKAVSQQLTAMLTGQRGSSGR